MLESLRVRSPWSQLAILLGLLGAAFILISIIMVITMMVTGINPTTPDLSNQSVINTMKILQGISSLIIFLLPAIIYAIVCFRNRPFYHLGLRSQTNLSLYAIAILVMFAALPFVFWLGQLNQSFDMPQWAKTMEENAGKQLEAFLRTRNTMDIVINVILIALLPAVCEEILFRGALQGIIHQMVKHPWTAIILTGFLFSALHFQFQGFLPRTFLGILLGALYYYSGSLWPCMLAHFVNNAVQVIGVSQAPEYIQKNPSVPAFAGILSAVVVAGLLFLYRKTASNQTSPQWH